MRKVKVWLPDDICFRLEKRARDAGVSIEDFVAGAISRAVALEETRDFHRKAAARLNPAVFAEALYAVDSEPSGKAAGVRTH